MSGDYYDSIMDSIHLRVLQGCVRLSGILGRVFDKSSKLNKDDIELREKIKKYLKK